MASPRPSSRDRVGAVHRTMKATAILMIVAMSAAFALTASAQFPGGGGGPGSPGAGDRRGGMGGSRANRDGPKPDQAGVGAEVTLASVVQLRLFELEEDLKLTPEQRPLWSTYAGQILKLLTDISRAGSGVTVVRDQTNALQQFDRIADIARNRLTAIEDITDAGKALYAKLTPEQQALADRRLVLALLPLSGGESLRSGPRAGAPPRGDALNSTAESASKR
jgi:hypothetical protein